jgi:GNAT superfamily N-acetyltransferase
MRIREAERSDALAIATVHVRGWQWAYRDLLPHALLDRLSVPDRAAWRDARLANPPAGERTWVIEVDDGRVVGFAVSGPARGLEDPPTDGEVYAIYLDPTVVGTGTGRELFDHALSALRGDGYRRALVWVLEANDRARRFYEAAGFACDGGTKTDQFEGVELPEVRYAKDLEVDR